MPWEDLLSQQMGAEVIPEPDYDDEVTSCDPYDPEEWERDYAPRRPEIIVEVKGGYLL
jgi:hypothetical protein